MFTIWFQSNDSLERLKVEVEDHHTAQVLWDAIKNSRQMSQSGIALLSFSMISTRP